ncbi:MAG: DUF3990 domain-containing protein [Clostridiales bacterium]|nr:DUF3990 domain-containing protein [Clostridiales bacterium]
MGKQITIYHGSKQIVEIPTFGSGRKNNDFGLGFYCTESLDLAKEWAVSSLSDGFANRYSLDIEHMNILNLNSPDYTILNSITVEQLSRAMRLGKPGEQIVLKSQFAFSRIKYEGFEIAQRDPFYVLRKARDDKANQSYFDIQEETSDGLYIQDILRGGISNDDPRIPRNISQ